MIGVEHRGQPFEAFYDKYRKVTEKHNQLQRKKNKAALEAEKESNMIELAAQMGTLNYEFNKLEEEREVLNTGKDDPTNLRAFKLAVQKGSKIPFSHEEDYGKYLNLHKYHLEFLNIKGIQKGIDYAQYVSVLDELE